MKLWLRLYKSMFIIFMKKYWWKYLLIMGAMAIFLIMLSSSVPARGPSIFFIGLTAYVIIAAFWLIFDIALLTAMRFSDYKALNNHGFSPEYLNYYYNKYIFNKPKNDYHYIIYAEGFVKIGDCKSAIETLNTLVIPESKAGLRTMYLYVYLMSALKMNDSAMADDIWRTNQAFLTRCMNNRNSDFNKFLYLAIIGADCAAGRYERALDTINRYLSGELDRNYKEIEIDFTSLKVYVLNKLERYDEMNMTANISLSLIAKKKPFLAYEWQEAELHKELEMAKNGILPL